ncbi:hypothetical protein MHUMG1_10494 [Metarhizium humberi]|uniref:Rhodopsin domain-containing protein n=1 Tax=Metarhizium humberi TaxID=2596975 RepID=A0A9P8M1N2_9HYPO|nr:hypothetical protein MHUMG1_10494 [Metarhizium humberi]
MASEMNTSPEYTGYRLEVFIAVFTPLTIIAVALRFYARSLTSKKIDSGDWLIIAALVGQIVAGGIAIGAVKQAGVGHHAAYLAETNPETLVAFFKYLVAMSTWYATTEGLAKLAVCILYKRLFPQRGIHIVINTTMLVLVGASVGGGLADLFGCTPFSAHWGTAEEQAAHCIDTEALFVWGSFPNIVTDVVLLVLPMPIVWGLHASVRLRLVLVLTFLFGSIFGELIGGDSGLITSVLRFIAFYNKSSFIDPTFHAVELIIWTVCEPGVYLIAACLLVYRPLLEKIGIPLVGGVSSRGGNRQEPTELAFQKPSRPHNGAVIKSIGSGSISESGFEYIGDDDQRPLRRQGGITATTNVEVTWAAGSAV